MKKSLLSAVALTTMLAFGSTAWADVLVGIAAPLSGPDANIGKQVNRGAEQAVTDINAAGGINGEKVRIKLHDDGGDRSGAAAVAKKFAEEGVKFVVGHPAWGTAIPASDVYAENGIMLVTPASTDPQLTKRGLWNTFRTCGSDGQQGAVAGQYIADHFKDAKVAIVHDKTPYGENLAEETMKAMNAAGIKQVMYEGMQLGEKDYSALVTKMKEAGVDVVYFGGFHTEAELIIRQMSDQGLNATFMSGGGIAPNELASVADKAAGGILITSQPDPHDNPNAKNVVEKFRAAGFEPEASALYSYAAVQVIAEAAQAAGSNDPIAVADAAKSKGPWKTVIGDIGFDKYGDISSPDYTMHTWKKGDDGKYTYSETGL